MSIYADRKNGKLSGRFCVEVQVNKRVMKARVNTYAEAQEKEQELRRLLSVPAVANGVRTEVLGITVGSPKLRHREQPQTLLEALERCQQEVWRNWRHREYQSAHVREIARLIGKAKVLKQITTEDMDGVSETLRGRGLKDVTINKYFSAARVVLKWCLKRGYVPGLPGMPWYEEGEGRLRWLTYDEEATLDRLLRSYGPTGELVADFVTVAIDTGMRRGELLSLTPAQVEADWVHLQAQGGDLTKTRRLRSIPLMPRAKAILEARRATEPRSLFRGLPEYTLRWFGDRAREEMGLAEDEGFVVHALRHTCATRLVNDHGIDVFTVQKWMGHKDLGTTRRYVHINEQSLARARDKVVSRTHKTHLLGECAGGGPNGGGVASPTYTSVPAQAPAPLQEVA
jgi:integrase